jgi:hypothetical protein
MVKLLADCNRKQSYPSLTHIETADSYQEFTRRPSMVQHGHVPSHVHVRPVSDIIRPQPTQQNACLTFSILRKPHRTGCRIFSSQHSQTSCLPRSDRACRRLVIILSSIGGCWLASQLVVVEVAVNLPTSWFAWRLPHFTGDVDGTGNRSRGQTSQRKRRAV